MMRGRFLNNPATVSGGSGTGDVTGPVLSTDNALARWDGASGDILQNSGIIIDDSNNVTGLGTLNTRTIANWTDGPASSTDNALARFDLATGKIIQNSGAILDDSNNLIGLASLGINTGSSLAVTKLQVVETVTTSPRGIMSSQYNSGTDGARFHMRKGRGTLSSPTTIVTGDNLGRLVASGYDGANYQEMASVIFGTEGTIGAGRVPTNIQFLTATDAATSVLTERMRINSAGLVSIGDSTNIGNMALYATKTSIHTFHENNINEDDVTWTMTGSGPLVHVAGNTTTITLTNSEAIVTGTTYKVTITGTGGGGTATYTLGGVTGKTIAASGAIAITDYITANTTASLIITPASACTVSITAITIEKLIDSTGDLTVEGNVNAKSQFIAGEYMGAGSGTNYPQYSFTFDATTGFGARYSTSLDNYVASALVSRISSSSIVFPRDVFSIMMGASLDVVLARLSANSLAMINSTNAQTFSIYETYTDGSNYESYSLDAGVTTGDTLTIKANSAGTGSANLGIALAPKGTGALNLGISTSLLGFYGVSAIARATLATGAGKTVDDVITALQNLGLVKQS